MTFDKHLKKCTLSSDELSKLDKLILNKDERIDKLMEHLEDAYADVYELRKENKALQAEMKIVVDKELKNRYYIKALYDRLERTELEVIRAEVGCALRREIKGANNGETTESITPKGKRPFWNAPFHA